MNQLHWSVYVCCAGFTTAGGALLIASDVTDAREFGRWGLAMSLLACVAAGIIVCDRFARRIYAATLDESARRMDQIEDLVESERRKVVREFHGQTEEIAEAVCSAVIGVVRRDQQATPIRPR